MRSWLIILLVVIVSCSHKTSPPVESEMQQADQANKIILAVNENPQKSYQNIVQYISDQGFRIHVNDASSLNIQTAYKLIDTTEAGRSFFRLNASVVDSTVHFYGHISNSLEEKVIINTDGEELYTQAWQELVDIAEGYPHEKIYFTRD